MMWAFSLTINCVLEGRSATVLETVHLLDQDGRINDDSVADNAKLSGMKNAGRDEVQDGLLPLDDQGMSGIIAALEPGDDIGVCRIEVDDFSLSFITPLGSHNNHICHTDISPNKRLPLKTQGSLHFQFGDRDHVRQSPEFFDHIRGGAAVGAQDDHRLAVDLFAAQVKSRDVDAACAQGRADVADNARLVLVEHDEHPPFRDDLDRKFVDPHDPRLLTAEDGSCGAGFAFGGLDRHGDHACIVFYLAAFYFDHLDPAFLGDERGVDVIYALVEDGGKEPLEQRYGDRGDIIVKDLSAVLNDDLLDAAGNELGLELSQLLRQDQIGADHGQELGA